MIGFINDGYSLTAYIAAAPASKSGERLWDSLEFTYRPATRMELAKHDAEVRIALRDEFTDANAVVKSEKLASEFVNQHVLTWEVKFPDGSPVTKNADMMGKLHPTLFESMYRIIRGMRTSDPRPEGDTPTGDGEQLKN